MKIAEKKPGEYSKSQISNKPADLTTERAQHFEKSLHKFADEAIYIYSFKENKMIYTNGWEAVLGFRDDEISMMKIVELTTPHYAPFSNELNDKALLFAFSQKKEHQKYGFTIELKKFHKSGKEVPMIVKVSVLTAENGMMTEIIGRLEINKSITLGKVMRYSAYGPEKSKFEEELNEQLFHHFAISSKEKKTIELVAQGLTYKEIASELKITLSAVEKRILNIYRRFGVKSLAHLISFSYDNHILP